MRQVLAGGYHYQMSGKGLEIVTDHYTHIYIMDIAIKFTCEYTTIQTVELCPEFCWTRTLHITSTMPELNNLLKKKALTSLLALRQAYCAKLFDHISSLNSFLHGIKLS